MLVAKERVDFHYAEQATRQRPAKRPVARKRKKENVALLLTVVMVGFILGLVAAYRYAMLAQAGYRLDQLQKQLALAEAENQQLQMQVDQLKSLQRIEAIATTKLGMVRPDGTQMVAVTAPVQAESVHTAPVKEKKSPVVSAAQTIQQSLTEFFAQIKKGTAEARIN
ncbi:MULTISPECIES: cell division protein FtsL [Carboxydocella]|uniref:Cell division protein FtsL n=2 Tax=Carboxydocella TaxID=178898 RepID=A0A1T4M542_9FIRM|nr:MULTISPECIES: cell division protein FtsL [Carboxydocella]AVX21042.1 cell division protein FtsL [Carboxydocella thermautotrophica]AVX31462.1 cell division protein FtsL [Carboxydocella thermautotrophica]GAW28798.1 cell division protein FtsL [Carboxydocella sp. ULO1]SJZ62119.1 cell division protein FtsL [Carboxydocella sporoproducens DSM 16521]